MSPGDRIEKCYGVYDGSGKALEIFWKRGYVVRRESTLIWVKIDGRDHVESAHQSHIRPLPALDQLSEIK